MDEVVTVIGQSQATGNPSAAEIVPNESGSHPNASVSSSTVGPLARSTSSELNSADVETIPATSVNTSSHCVLCRQHLKLLKDVILYPFRAHRGGAFLRPPFTVPPVKAMKMVDAFHGVEIVEVSSQLIVMATFLFHVMRIPTSEIRERILSWLTVLLVLLSLRCIVVALLLEQGRGIFRLSSVIEVRTSLITLLRSTRMAAARWLYLVYLGWFCLGWQILWVYRDFKRRNPSPPPYQIKYSGDRFNSPMISHDPLENLTMELLGYLLMGSLILGVIHVISVSISCLYLLYRKQLTISAWLTVLDPGTINLNQWESTWGVSINSRQSIPRHILDSFPVLQWKGTWSLRSTESISSTQDSSCCSVCLLSFENGDTIRVLPCAHVFHRGCIDTWLSNHTECPLRCTINLSNEFHGDFGHVVLEDRLPMGLVHAIRQSTKSSPPCSLELVTTTASPASPTCPVMHPPHPLTT
eukprot:Gregarina_sp_Poly_1__6779@NODE_365_length_9176_cov_254_590076_g301_i0_p3_GENE_NODE_365_length_9176_cov_254_590076_g301_i0NODE_365_length_9176_cov_254_590076_g301_i0_p3_ORF_typecomplete_len469_score28_66zfRING_2/PF13639_6/1_6e03zfRING_2/PF13639_6/1_9e13zfRING_11/PF17123_5/1_8e11zfC3HC4_2/PF13923_6/5_2e10zfC3HC4_2/PF13923_6/3_7e03zfC3HC4/PF00097_25/5_5e08zfC3HC4/PF00097_25/7_9e02zfrbx1/PF12678_7/9_7e02zfrbx1/PF12678_7/2e07zfRING_UBOX/PF13445_6/5_3e06Zn_ribbon_17/PF17120_5/8_6e02Zn_ribbon_17/PF1712